MKQTQRTEYFEVLGERFSKIHYPELYSMYKISPKNLEVQLSSLAEKWHNGSINSASRCFESDLEQLTGANTKLVWLPDELNNLFGQEVYTFNLKDRNSFCVRSSKLYQAGKKQDDDIQKKNPLLKRGGFSMFEKLHAKAVIDSEGILEVSDRYKDIFSYDKPPSFEIIDKNYFIVHFDHEN
ncbi:MAG: hypothetical protein RLZZ517_75 [Candidatus Parcubacteria bacterium]|jgi:hypothetical protein